MSSLKRGVLSGESFFVTEYVTGEEAGFIDLAPALPGDVLSLQREYNSENIIVTRGSWLANSPGITLDSKWGGFKTRSVEKAALFPTSPVKGLLSRLGHGALIKHDRKKQGRRPWTPGISSPTQKATVALRKASKGGVRGVLNSIGTGEGLVFEFSGHGTVWTQSRNPSAFAGWVASNHSHGNR